ncbi:hypothetical protein [Thalassospira sp.]|uniref:HEAT repeat domain-containing protein n=1 Tax=Thalassospira sp. TaxID=1912094 RepID=UPI0032EB36DA
MSALVPTSATGGAKAALDGFEYQVGVSVLTALRLMLITKSTSQITLEPANEEDLEVDVEASAPGRVVPSANMAEGYTLVVQVKLRNTGPWSISDFDALLQHGTTRRPAKHHLDDSGTRYLLITNADTTGVARNLLVRSLEEWPEQKTFPRSLSKTLPHAPEGRIAIWGVLTPRLLDLEIKDILGSLLRVPQSRQAECRAQLEDEALQLMRGMNPGVWTREDLLSVIGTFGGYLASAPQLESFVPPANYRDLLAVFERHNALVITGPSGTGKTWTAQAVIDHARQQPSPPEIIQVNVNNGPSSTRTLTNTGPKLFYVEDPWGQYSLRGGGDEWTEQLPRLLREAHAGHQYVITSRTDMLGQARAGERLNRWSVVLDADQYRDGELAIIYEKRLELLATELQAKAMDFTKDALDELKTPFEVDLFFSYMADGPRTGEVDRAFFQRILAMAHRDAVEDVVVAYLDDSDQTGASAIIWALLAARSQFDRSQLISLSQQLRIIEPTVIDGLEKLVNRLVATRHLRQPGQIVSFSHPSVRAGFEIFIKENWGSNEAVLMSMISSLIQISGSHQGWAMETAALCCKAINDLVSSIENFDTEFQPDSASRAAIDDWLEDSLVDPQSDFWPVLKLASDVGTQTSIPSEVARWFIKGIRRGSQVFMSKWEPPSFDNAWYARVSNDPRTFTIADRFVRQHLPQDRDGYGDDFAVKLDQIASDLTLAFVEAAHKLIVLRSERNVSAIAVGAVRNLTAYESVLVAALDELASLDRFFEREGKEQWRSIRDGECDEAHEEGYQSRYEDEGYAAGIFVKTYVGKVRSLGQWETLAAHPRISEMGRAWADDIGKAGGSVSVEEIRAVIAVTQISGGEEHAWEAACEHWQAFLASDLEQRILSNPEDESVRAALVYCALMKSPTTLSRCFDQLSTTTALFVQLLIDMHRASRRISGTTRVQPILTSISSAGTEIFQALSIKDRPPLAVGQTALTLLSEAAQTAVPFVLDKIVPVMIVSGAIPSAAIHRWLCETEDFRLSKSAAEAAVDIKDDTLAWAALDHPRADARKVAIEYLATTQPDPLPQRLLNLWSDPGNRVRRALVRILTDRPHPDHQSVLIRLINDGWSDASVYCNDPPSYPIARDAICGLAAYGDLTDEIGEALLLQAERTDDRELGVVALQIAAQHCGPEIRKKIWALSSSEQARWDCVAAIDALTLSGDVESDILTAVTATLILQLPPPLAASACFLLATCGQIDIVVSEMERIAFSKKRRALLLLGARSLADRGESDAANGLLELLGADHPARRLLDLADGEQLPASVLGDLGHIRIRKVVQEWLFEDIAND